MACDRWHMTHDMWPVTRDMWHMIRNRWWTLCKNFRSLALLVWDLGCFEDLEEMDRWLDGGVCRTAPATPGLLITVPKEEEKIANKVWWPSFNNSNKHFQIIAQIAPQKSGQHKSDFVCEGYREGHLSKYFGQKDEQAYFINDWLKRCKSYRQDDIIGDANADADANPTDKYTCQCSGAPSQRRGAPPHWWANLSVGFCLVDRICNVRQSTVLAGRSPPLSNLYRSNIKGRYYDCAANTVDCLKL